MTESPCIGECRVEDGVCVGCNRTLQQIKDWPEMSPERRREILEALDD